MFDRFGREINYLRVSVTDRCNLRCAYCMPAGGVTLIPHEDVLRYEEILEVVRAAVALGVTKVRLTGGEPLVRRGIIDLVRMLSGVPGIIDFGMTTNGILLPEFAQALRAAGLHRVNVSLDALDPERYAALTRGGDVRQVLEGIHAARAAGLTPIKINCVVQQGSDEPDADDVARFAAQEGLDVRFIRQMHLPFGRFSVVIGGTGGDCVQCNRLRLSSNGHVRPCLMNDLAFSVRELGAEEALRLAVGAKPLSGQTCQTAMNAIGG